jgi:internalin A
MVAKPNHRWYQFSLKAVFVGMTLLSVALAVWLKCIEPAEQQRAMVRRVQGLGGYVRYAEASSGESWPVSTLRRWLPRDYFDPLIEINLEATKTKAASARDGDLADLSRFKHLRELWLNGTEITDATLAKIGDLKELRVVNLRGTKITDQGLANLAELTELQILNLRDTKVGNDGLAHVKGLTQLQILNLRNTRIDDAGTESLPGLVQLQSLFLDSTRVTDERKTELRAALPKCDITPENLATLAEQEQAKRQLAAAESVTNQGGRIHYNFAIPIDPKTFPLLTGRALPHVIQVDLSDANRNDALYPMRLVQLREFPRLRYLNLNGTNVGDDQLTHIAGCAELTQLKLDNTAITDAGLMSLTDLKNLTVLSLCKTHVTDAGVIHLANLPRLRLLQLKDTQVTDMGVEKLQRTLPKATIVRQ